MSEEIKHKTNIAAYIVKQFKNRNIFVFLIFVIISSFLWFLNAINKEHDTEMKIPYKFENLPAKANISKDSPSDLTVLIHGHGYNLLREKIEQVKLPVVINFADKENPVVFHRNENNPLTSYVLTTDLIPFLSIRFGSNIQVTGVKPDTLFFDFAESYSKKVPVIVNPIYSINKEYILTGSLIVTPDSVFIYGPKHITDTVKFVTCASSDLGLIGESHIKEIKIDAIKELSFSKSKVLINIPVEKYTETSIEVDIATANFPDSLKYQLIPNKVTISYKVPLSQYDLIDKNNFEAVVNYKLKKNDQIGLEITSINPYLIITKTNPISVGFILERKK